VTVTEVSVPPAAVTLTGSPGFALPPRGVTVTVAGRSADGFPPGLASDGEGVPDEHAVRARSAAAAAAARTDM
jgi:hypothetical protein